MHMISYLVTVVLSAMLLFFVQPLMGKVILPWFGGSAGLWSVVLLFFQFLLLLGYTYSFLVTTYLNQRTQVIVHISLVIAAFIILLMGILGDGIPLLPGEGLKPSADTLPVLRILVILGSSIGLPYFLLATTGPLLQSWYAKNRIHKSPYWLYALSNAGSFLALILYPFIVEPLVSVRIQAWLWSIFFFIFGLSVGYVTLQTRKFISLVETPPNSSEVNKQKRSRPFKENRTVSLGSVWNRRSLSAEEQQFMEYMTQAAQWFLLSLCPTVLLTAVTNQITQDVAPIPLLWILPLGLYLASFVISFSLKRLLTRLAIPLLGIATFGMIYALSQGNILNIPVQIGIYCSTFFIACLVSHGELARLQPETRLLTAYYLIISLGGVSGTLLVSLLAPIIFTYYWEFHLGYLLCWTIILVVIYLDKGSIFHGKRSTMVLYALLIPPVSFLLFTLQYYRTFQTTTLDSGRNFYGVLRIQEFGNIENGNALYVLSHGTTIHGMQYKASELRSVPIAYFNEDSGVGRVLIEYNKHKDSNRVGVLGLGIGSLAAYGRKQDVYRFYEINPDVVDWAEGREGYFTYVPNAEASVDIVLGDARLSLEREMASGGGWAYDILVLDVFSGDAIPVHLLTEECIALYLKHLSPGGVIAVHISTSHLNLAPLLARIAEKWGLYSVLVEDEALQYPCCASRWVLMSRNSAFMSFPLIQEVAVPLEKPDSTIRIWTDDYSNPLMVMN